MIKKKLGARFLNKDDEGIGWMVDEMHEAYKKDCLMHQKEPDDMEHFREYIFTIISFLGKQISEKK